MSHSETPTPTPEIGFDSLTDKFHTLLRYENNKPDFKELDLGSPVSHLRTRSSGGRATSSTPAHSSSSSSGSVSSKTGNNPVVKRADKGGNNNSGELSGSSENSPTAVESFRFASVTRNPKPGHRKSNSCSNPLIYSAGSAAVSSINSPVMSVLPNGNICPSGKLLKTGMGCRNSARKDVLGSGIGNYGHGSIMRGTIGVYLGGDKGASSDLEEVKRVGNEQYIRGNFVEALCLYDQAIAISPNNAVCRNNRAAALVGLGRLTEAVRECEEAVRLDPGYGRAHQRLVSLYLRFGQVENAQRHLYFPGQRPDPAELQKLRAVENHMSRCANARKIGDWKSALREGDAAIAAGADTSPQLFACRVEALLKLYQLKDADSGLANIPKFETFLPSYSQTKFSGMLSKSYVFFVRAQVEMALGRFENAVEIAEKAGKIDPKNIEISVMLNNVRLVARARACGNDLFNSGKFNEACSVYGEGLKFDPSNSVLYCNRAACWSKLRQWERSIEDCNQALRFQPNYTKALLRRAASNGKLERWAESVRDYEVLRRELPGDNEVAESLFHAQLSLKKSQGEETYNLKFGGEVVEISDVNQFGVATSSPGVSVVHFKAGSNQQCEQISPFVNMLCVRYPSINFFKVDVEESRAVAKSESVRIVPTFKIYKKGIRVKEMICPSDQVLEYSVRHYSL